MRENTSFRENLEKAAALRGQNLYDILARANIEHIRFLKTSWRTDYEPTISELIALAKTVGCTTDELLGVAPANQETILSQEIQDRISGQVDTIIEAIVREKLQYMTFSLNLNCGTQGVKVKYYDSHHIIRQFFNELSGRFVWDLLPYTFLYALFAKWTEKNTYAQSMPGRAEFNAVVTAIANEGRTWYCPKKTAIRPGNRMDKPEPLIWEYGIDWKPAVSYRGLLRRPDAINN